MLGFRLPFTRRKGYGMGAAGGGNEGVGAVEPGLFIDFTNGVDATGDGSFTAPYKTLSKALSVVNAGGIINAKTAVYSETGLTCNTNGVTIKAAAGATPVFTHATLYNAAAWSKTAGQVNVYEAAFAPTSCWGVFDGGTMLSTVASINACDAAANSRFFDDPGNKLYINLAGAVPGNIYVEQGNAYLLTVAAPNVTVRGLTFQYSLQSSLEITGQNATIAACTAQYLPPFSGGNGFAPFHLDGCNGANVTGCTISRIYGSTSTTNRAIGLTNATNCVINGCTISNVGSGVTISGGTGCSVTNCTITNGGFDGIVCTNGTFTASGNTITNTVHGGITLETGLSTGNVHHNLIYWDANALNGAYYGIIDHTGTAANVYHNVVAQGKDPAAATVAGYLCAASGTSTYKNNIAYNNDTGYSYSSGTLVTDYNGAYGNSTNYAGGWTEGAHGVTTDPLFTDQANDVYTLQSGSPYIDAGVAIGGINDGYLGAAPDIGYQEKA